MRMFFGDFDAEQSGCTSDIAQAAIAREMEFVGQRFEVDTRQAVIPSRKHSSFSGSAYNSLNMFFPPCLVSFCGFPVRSASGKSFQYLNSRALSISGIPPM